MDSSFIYPLLNEPDHIAIRLLSLIADRKSMRFEELLKSNIQQTGHSKFVDDSDYREKIRGRLKLLEENGLIKKKSSVVEEFDIYYITAGGLNAKRKLTKFSY